MVTKEALEQVFERQFTGAKDNWKAKCPFHDERTPSFYVHKENLVGHCFGCGAAGSIDVLAGQYLQSDKYEAQELLGITIHDKIESNVSRFKKGRSRWENPTYFPESWLAPFPKEAHRYVLDRGIGVQALRAAGARYDRTLHRQVFPHYHGGKLLGATGRSVVGMEPKWYFYWNYDKGAALWEAPPPPADLYGEKGRGVGFEVGAVRPRIVVEGIFDALALWQNGIYNVAAIQGSHATHKQIQEIRRSREVIIMLDNDEAGRSGTEALYNAIKKSNFVRFFEWPDHCNDAMDLTETHFMKFNQYQKNALQRRLGV